MGNLFVQPLFFIFFIYGAAFLAMAWLVARGVRGSSEVPLVAPFRLLALFGLTHGITEMTDWVRFIRRTLGGAELAALTWVSQVCLIFSFVLLLQFGINLLAARSPGGPLRLLRWLPSLGLAGLVAFAVVTGLGDVTRVGLLSRYGFGFTGSVVAAAALLATASVVKLLDEPRLTRSLHLAAAGFAAYAVFGGLAISPIAGLPIQLFRAGCAVVIAVACSGLLRLSATFAPAPPAPAREIKAVRA